MPESLALRPILFDIGGVIVDSHPDPAHIASLIGDGSPALVSLVDQAMWAHRDAYDAGCSDREFWDRVSGDCGKPQVSDEILAQLVAYDAMRIHDANPDTVALINELADAGVPLGILSNAPHPIARELYNTPWSKAFTTFAFSCDIGACKPHRAIYRRALELLDCSGCDVAFIDDRKRNVRAAELVGIKGLLWNGADAMRAQLVELGYLD